MRRHWLMLFAGLLGWLAAAAPTPAEEAPAFAQAQEAAGRFRLAKGLAATAWAAEPQIVNPVCLSIDEKGRVYVVETQRFHGGGGVDMREHEEWIDEDLACRMVQDRIALVRRRMGDGVKELMKDSDRVRVLEDPGNSGMATSARTLADGFNAIEDGIAAGILARNGEVWLADIPHLWKLGEGRRQKLLSGFGVRYSYMGNDLHGPTMGPDGRLYLSIGDRGLSVRTAKGLVECLDSGAVLRCNPDGTELEIVATGLRNPQDLAFDQYGNLFAGDNNSDKGDAARWVYVVEGGDSGWRVGYQHMRWPDITGPWKSEKLWGLEGETKAAYLVPPVGHIANGPAGCAFYPGVGLAEKYANHFLLCDFRGGSNSGIHSFAVKAKGASFELADRQEFVWQVLATDVAFGPDGAAYVLDWVDGWMKPNKGRIYRVFDPTVVGTERVTQVQRLLKEGMGNRGVDELVSLLGHADQRVRLAAQFELAGRGDAGAGPLLEAAARGESTLARIHAIWGVGQIGRKQRQVLQGLVGLLDDGDAEVRAQAAKVLGEGKVGEAFERLTAKLADESPRVRFFAAMAIGKLGRAEGTKPVLEMLRANGDRDAYLRHAGVMALVGIGDAKGLERAAGDPSPAVRMGALLAMRRMKNPAVADFLQDPQGALVVEAARAINDVPIPEAMPALAGMISNKDLPKPVWQRAVNANLRLGGAEHAKALAQFAAVKENPEQGRIDALMALSEWAAPSGRDRVVGLWRPIARRDAKDAQEAAKGALAAILKSGPDPVRMAALKLVEELKIADAAGLLELISAKDATVEVRSAALATMAAVNDAHLTDAVMVALRDGKASLRREAIRIQAKVPGGMKQLAGILEKGSVADQQVVLQALGMADPGAADELLASWMDRLLEGKVAKEVRLDVVEAAEKSKNPSLVEKVQKYERSRPMEDPLARWRDALYGGDAEAGQLVFTARSDVACARCHRVGTGKEDVTAGPDLRGIGATRSREQILESIVRPTARIAAGFESVAVKTKDGKSYVGLLKSENEQVMAIEGADHKVVEVQKSEVVRREKGPSPMPEDLAKKLSMQDLRNLLEFLANRK